MAAWRNCGKAMYNVLVHKQINNVLAVVVRYWGGVKLGAGGFNPRLRSGDFETCKLAQLIAPEITREFTVIVAYAAEAATDTGYRCINKADTGLRLSATDAFADQVKQS